MFQTAAQECVAEAEHLLKTFKISLAVRVVYNSTVMMLCYRAGTIEIPGWQGVRAFGPLRADFVRTLLHEYGHALWEERYEQLTRMGLMRVFGDHGTPYPDTVDLFLSRCLDEASEGYVSGYAQMHPEEDFAETFAWVVTQRPCPRNIRQPVLRRKVQFVWDVLRKR